MVRGTAINDYTQQERVRILVDRDGARIGDFSVEEADTIRRDRRVDERVRGVLTDLTVGIAER